ncbi:hypothetical protein EJB05_33426, partial [Eragrostis curvula]
MLCSNCSWIEIVMEPEQEAETSSGVYTYKHHCERGLDIHEIIVRKSRSRVLLSYIGIAFLLATVCRSLLAKLDSFLTEAPFGRASPTASSAASHVFQPKGVLLQIVALTFFNVAGPESWITLEYYLCFSGRQMFAVQACEERISSDNAILWGSAGETFLESLNCWGLLLSAGFSMFSYNIEQFPLILSKTSGRVDRRFVPIGKILKPLLNECVTPVTCYWSLALLLRDEEELLLVFQKFRPPVKMLVPVWKALCTFINIESPSRSGVHRPNSSET